MRDLNSSIARAVPRYAPAYTGGRLWERRYSAEFLPGSEDIEEWFFYTVLQAVNDGHVEKISQYPGYNCFHDAVYGIKRTFKVMNWTAFNERRRWKKNVCAKDFIEEVTLEYKRLPGYEHLTQKEYAKLMHEKLEQRRLAILEKRRLEGKSNGRGEHLRQIHPGSRPKNTKTSTLKSHRPRVLSICNVRRAKCKAWYFKQHFEFKDASLRYRRGDLTVIFPPGMFRPPSFTIEHTVPREHFAA